MFETDADAKVPFTGQTKYGCTKLITFNPELN